jgi:hypothetical protein
MDPLQTVFTIPKETYFVAYPGTIIYGEVVTIPNKHRREGDSQDNAQVRVVIQNIFTDYAVTGYNHAPLAVLDNSNALCAEIYVPNAWQIETDTTLKLQRINSGAVASATTGFRVIVFYKKP